MLPAASHPVWVQIATGKKPVQSGNLAINLLAKSNKNSFERDPSSENVKLLAAKTHEFFIKYELVFASEFAQILK
jgi:hypothetical protein